MPHVQLGRTSTLEEIQSWLIARITQALGRSDAKVGLDTEFSRLALDSLVAVRISGELETLLGRPLDPALLWDYPTIGAAAAYLAEGQKPDGSR